MPVFGQGPGNAPAWCERECFEIIPLLPGESIELTRRAKKEKMIVCEGRASIEFNGTLVPAAAGADIDLDADQNSFIIRDVKEPLVAVWMSGRWGNDIGGVGLFTVTADTPPPADDTPYDYEKTTAFDNHYHDCDEYWIIYRGSGVVYSEGIRYEVKPGLCVATGAGFHHDFPQVTDSPVRAVYFETTLERGKRPGHLHEPHDGPAVPAEERR